MSWTPDDYRRLGEQMRKARRDRGYRNLKQFQDFLDNDPTAEMSGRTYADIENGRLGKRKQFSSESLAVIEELFGWFTGATGAILDGQRVDPVTGAELVRADRARVGGEGEGDDSLLFRRPEGLSDEQWEALKSRERSHWEWEISQASQER